MSDEVKRGRGRPKKDPYDLLSDEFKDAIASASPDEINKRIAEIAKGAAANTELLKSDPVVNEAKDELKKLTAPYGETKKAFGQQLAFCREKLADKGKDNTGALESLRVDQEG
jgi:hypothetical protein